MEIPWSSLECSHVTGSRSQIKHCWRLSPVMCLSLGTCIPIWKAVPSTNHTYRWTDRQKLKQMQNTTNMPPDPYYPTPRSHTHTRPLMPVFVQGQIILWIKNQAAKKGSCSSKLAKKGSRSSKSDVHCFIAIRQKLQNEIAPQFCFAKDQPYHKVILTHTFSNFKLCMWRA